MDRTEWDFGTFRINILALGIVGKSCAFPILFTVLPKKGNSNTDERIALIDRFIRLFGRDVIGSLLADQEFVGNKCICYLKGHDIQYFIRVSVFANGKQVRASEIGRKGMAKKTSNRMWGKLLLNGL